MPILMLSHGIWSFLLSVNANGVEWLWIAQLSSVLFLFVLIKFPASSKCVRTEEPKLKFGFLNVIAHLRIIIQCRWCMTNKQHFIMCLHVLWRKALGSQKKKIAEVLGCWFFFFPPIALLTHDERLLFLIKATNGKVISLRLYGSGRRRGF